MILCLPLVVDLAFHRTIGGSRSIRRALPLHSRSRPKTQNYSPLRRIFGPNFAQFFALTPICAFFFTNWIVGLDTTGF
jgi:hypothetical protein